MPFLPAWSNEITPEYRGLPVVVGGEPNGRGVVAAASYEVRAYGVRSAMSCYEAKKRCPHAIFVRPRFDVYRAVSAQIQALMLEMTTLVEPLSLDEAYLDVTAQPHHGGSATLMANALRARIYHETGLTASAGVSYNKMLAKIASDINKPNGIAVITPDMADEFLATLSIERFFGIGKASSAKLHDMGVQTGGDLRALELSVLVEMFGQKRGQFYHDIARGHDERMVKPERVRKSVGAEITFSENLTEDTMIFARIREQCHDAYHDLLRRQLKAQTITLKVKYSDFSQITRSHTARQFFHHSDDAMLYLSELFAHIPRHLPIRLVGVTFSHLAPIDSSEQLALFD